MATESGDWRSRRFEATHQRLYDVALALFGEHGFDRVSVGQIAKGAGVSVPTFYAHFASKEHLIMQVPVTGEFAALLAEEPPAQPLPDRFRRALHRWIAQWPPRAWDDALIRWRIIAATPALRTRAAEFERTSGDVIADAIPTEPGARLSPGDSVALLAYMSAYTAALLAWADGGGTRKLEEIVDEAFDALERR
ncbi:TetR/AcrR family transcriptional regulator [Blastococcus sp. PRF04-17]|uniref:TetR/AcrR family transcriptional regulator n=1 Tax=Blastococcus sp. PRF04-17 TaxID=2933797 RepID=UPI001FF62ACD|nr:TetR/AcrR family transcriptional regulator [Blastococcus sp. PRF04-17]UOY00507.1 TetR/AcrR family transcriptional regulator [Blastococcus sp. PRF04-17]